MASNINIDPFVVDLFERAMGAGSETKKAPENYRAKVMETDQSGTVWVHILGGSDLTPVEYVSASVNPGDMVDVRIENGKAFLTGNTTSPSAGVQYVEKVEGKADDAVLQASVATEAADMAVAEAFRASEAANQAVSDAAEAAEAASSAQSSAEAAGIAASSARTSADKANYALADVEKVVGTVNWIAEHGEYALTEDTVVDDSKVYYTRSGSGTDADPYVYSVVAAPDDSELAAYYELNIDESVQNYIASHLWLDDYGLNLSVDSANGYRIHQGTVDGSHPAGTYILDSSGDIVGKFSANGAQVGKDDESHLELDYHSLKLIDKDEEPYFWVSDLRGSQSTVNVWESWILPSERDGNRVKVNLKLDYSGGGSAIVWGTLAEATSVETVPGDPRAIWLTFPPNSGIELDRPVSVSYDSTEGARALTFGSRRPGSTGPYSISLGQDCEASGILSTAVGSGVVSGSNYQVVLGKYNIADTSDPFDPISSDNGKYAFIIGNGTDDDHRSNAFTVGWNGEVNGLALQSMGEIREASGTESVETATNRNVAAIRLPPGTWLVNAKLQYPNNSTGRRGAKLSMSSEDSGNPISADVRNAVSGGATHVQTERVFAITDSDVEGEDDGKAPVYLVAWQNSGSTLSCAGSIQAVRLSPAIGESYDGGGGGGGGTSDYADLTNKPAINGVTLSGDKSSAQLGLQYTGDESLPNEVSGTPNPSKNIIVDNDEMTIQANLLTAAQAAALFT